MNRTAGLTTVFALATLSLGAGGREGWEELHRPAAPFQLRDLGGRALRSEELAGKVVVVDFWATWCVPCIQELPDLAAYHARLRGRDDVALLSFNVTDDQDALRDFARDRKLDFPIYQADALVGPYELAVFPTKVVIDMRQGLPGVVRFRREGATSVASVEARVREVLAETR